MLELASVEELAEQLTDLHDCPFYLDHSGFDPSTSFWSGTFLHPVHDDRIVTRGIPLLISRYSLPVEKVVVSIGNIAEPIKLQDPEIGVYSFLDLEVSESSFKLRFNEALEIQFRSVGSFHATYEATELLGVTATYTSVFVAESGPKIEGDLGQLHN